MQCPACSFRNLPGLTVCGRCGSRLDLTGVVVEPPRRHAASWFTRLRRRWGLTTSQIEAQHGWVSRLGTAVRARGTGLWRRLAAGPATLDWPLLVRSLLPGWGQLHLGQRSLGLGLLGGWSAALLLTLAGLGRWWSPLLLVVAILVHGAAIGLGQPRWFGGLTQIGRILAGLLLFLVLRFGLYGGAAALGEQFVRPVTLSIAAPRSGELLAHDDVLLVQGPWLRAPRWRPGELVLYRQPGRQIGHLRLPEGEGVDRILAVAGQRLSLEQGALLVDGVPLRPEQGPLRPDPRLPEFSLQVESGQVAIIPSQALRAPLHGPLREPLRQQLLTALILVREEDLRGKVWWRLHPWSRLGRVR